MSLPKVETEVIEVDLQSLLNSTIVDIVSATAEQGAHFALVDLRPEVESVIIVSVGKIPAAALKDLYDRLSKVNQEESPLE